MCLSVSVMSNGLYRYGYYAFWLGYSIQNVPTEIRLGTFKVSVETEQAIETDRAESAEKKPLDVESSEHKVEELLFHLKCKDLLRKEVFAVRDSISRYIRYSSHHSRIIVCIQSLRTLYSHFKVWTSLTRLDFCLI